MRAASTPLSGGELLEIVAGGVAATALFTALGVGETIGKYGPSGAASGLGASAEQGGDLLGRLPAGLVLSTYVVVFLAAGIALMRRRDIG